jgi:hypothetical protein
MLLQRTCVIRTLDTGGPVGAAGPCDAAGAAGPVAPARRAVSGEPSPGSWEYTHVVMMPSLLFRTSEHGYSRIDSGDEAGPVSRMHDHGAALPVQVQIGFPRRQIRHPYRISNPQIGYLFVILGILMSRQSKTNNFFFREFALFFRTLNPQPSPSLFLTLTPKP